MKEKIIAIAKDALNSNDRCGTWFYKLKYATNNLWAICFSWMDYDNTGDFKLYGKVAYQPKNSMMQCDYDIDWIFPINSNGGGCNANGKGYDVSDVYGLSSAAFTGNIIFEKG